MFVQFVVLARAKSITHHEALTRLHSSFIFNSYTPNSSLVLLLVATDVCQYWWWWFISSLNRWHSRKFALRKACQRAIRWRYWHMKSRIMMVHASKFSNLQVNFSTVCSTLLLFRAWTFYHASNSFLHLDCAVKMC